MQWNTRGVFPRLNELKYFLSTTPNPPSVIALQETYLKPSKSFNLFGYDIIRKDRKDGKPGGGILFAIKQGISYTHIDLHTDLEIDC